MTHSDQNDHTHSSEILSSIGTQGDVSENAKLRQKSTFLMQENELLSLEIAKLDTLTKQNIALRKKLKHKEDECDSLTALIGTIKSANSSKRTNEPRHPERTVDQIHALRAENDVWERKCIQLEIENDEKENLIQDLQEKVELGRETLREHRKMEKDIMMKDHTLNEYKRKLAITEAKNQNLLHTIESMKQQREIDEEEEVASPDEEWKDFEKEESDDPEDDQAPTKYIKQGHLGYNHLFLGPSLTGSDKFVPHTTRMLCPKGGVSYISRPMDSEKENLENWEAERESNSDSSRTDGPSASRKFAVGVPRTLRKHLVRTSSFRPKLSVPSVIRNKRSAQRHKASSNSTKYAHKDSTCRFCKITPVVGDRYACSTCEDVEMCANCYGLGCHGMEDSDELFKRVETLVFLRCSTLATDQDAFLAVLRFDICNNNLRKYNFCLNWVADLLVGKSTRELQARALEIPNISHQVRKEFVSSLMELVQSRRNDLVIKTEWEAVLDQHTLETGKKNVRFEDQAPDHGIETLRIWTIDKFRTTSPFVEKSILKYQRDDQIAIASLSFEMEGVLEKEISEESFSDQEMDEDSEEGDAESKEMEEDSEEGDAESQERDEEAQEWDGEDREWDEEDEGDCTPEEMEDTKETPATPKKGRGAFRGFAWRRKSKKGR
uniref:Uncharacterized protein AlNc14C23G2368 n=1 Tax=Albugo laibachii Nc14 TaxID=890382 RepID=F0W669_9STRA|nr:conserved hypothetical protein [Albugo laibachii Nc14]|eukprot:CCA16611.1 conserved hypothetical protein [Albugo laibachii Nc14]